MKTSDYIFYGIMIALICVNIWDSLRTNKKLREAAQLVKDKFQEGEK